MTMYNMISVTNRDQNSGVEKWYVRHVVEQKNPKIKFGGGRRGTPGNCSILRDGATAYMRTTVRSCRCSDQQQSGKAGKNDTRGIEWAEH